MVNSISLFTSDITPCHSVVKLPDGKSATVSFIGTVSLSPTLVLKNVLCVPSFRFNLISASKLTTDLHCCLIFLSGYCLIQDLTTWKRIGLGKENSGLYVLQQHALDVSVNNSSAISLSSSYFDLWHYRLGHVSDSRISVLHNLDSSITCSPSFQCTTCPLAKQRHLSFNKSTSIASHPFDLIHSDIWGPFSIPTSSGHRYFLTIVDDCTRSL